MRTGAGARSRFLVVRIHQLEACPALELAGRGFAGGGIDVALAWFAQETRFYVKVALGRPLVAALLDEHAAADRSLSRCRREIGAIPAVGLIAVDDGEAQHVRHATFHDRPARITDHANPTQHAVLVEQYRQDHRMPRHPRADAALGV